MVSSGLLGVVGSTQDLAKVGQTSSKDDDRDWTGRIQRIVDRFKREQDKRITTPGDVTEHAIEQSLDAAFKKAKLDTFESFLGENWSAERLRVRILDRVAADLPHLFDGNNRGNAPMQDSTTSSSMPPNRSTGASSRSPSCWRRTAARPCSRSASTRPMAVSWTISCAS